MFESGWIDPHGDVIVTSSHETSIIWKYDAEFEQEKARLKTVGVVSTLVQWSPTTRTTCILQVLRGVTLARGACASSWMPDWNVEWQDTDSPSEGKPDYSLDIALDSHGNLYRVGCDSPDEDQGRVQGRVVVHYADNGKMHHTFLVDEPSSFVGGVLTDADSSFYFAYSHHAIKGSGRACGNRTDGGGETRLDNKPSLDVKSPIPASSSVVAL